MTNEELLEMIEEAKASGATWLNLSLNKLTILPPEIGQLIKLTRLDLSYNQLSSLPPEICQLPYLEEIHLKGNPLTSPPYEIALKGIEAIREYFNAFQNNTQIISSSLEIPLFDINATLTVEEAHPLNEAKIILIGDGASGKTSLTKRLISNEFDPLEPVTHGIRITPWPVESGGRQIKANIWDFGGQEIMHATHQFFLSKRSLYVIVLDGRKDEQAEYWLRHVSAFGGDSPVLIVLNKQDENCGFDLNRAHLLRKYPAVKGFYSTSCKKDTGIGEFRAALLTALAQVPLLETRWPKSWFLVKERLEQMPEPYISCDEYESYCKEAGIAERQSQEVLVEFLNDLGVAVHFKELELDDTHVLNPLWLTNGAYRLVTADQTALQGGVLEKADLRALLKKRSAEDYDYPGSRHRYLLALMRKFELCYELNNEAVLIPQLLPVKEPDFTFDESASLRFVLHYPHFLPPSVFPRFLVRVHKDIKADLRWRTGVVLVNEEFGAEALVSADNETRQVSIFVKGSQRKDYFAVLLLFFREINNSFEQLAVNELVPMPDAPEVMADYASLLEYVKNNIDQYIPPGSKKVYSVKELLGLVQFSKQDSGQEKIFDALERIEGRQIEDEKSFTEKAQNILDLKPTLFGITLNVNALFDAASELYKSWVARRKKRAETGQQVS
jgi:internalin A